MDLKIGDMVRNIKPGTKPVTGLIIEDTDEWGLFRVFWFKYSGAGTSLSQNLELISESR